MKVSLMSFFIIILFFSCASSNTSNVSEPDKPKEVSPADETSWIKLIDDLPGVAVSGSGKNARVRVMVGSTLQYARSEPLFLLNGVAYANNFESIQTSISPSDVDSFEVYTTQSELSFYGVRGEGGVIDIILK